MEQLTDALGEKGAEAFLVASNQPGPRTLRANTLVNDRDGLRRALADDGIATVLNPRTPWAVDVVGRANLFGCRAFRDGRFEVQDASSQAVVVAAAVTPGEVVVDMCAGRGGKTLALAAALHDRGTLWFDDVDERALADLRGRLGRARVTGARRGLPADGTADVVLVDSPCSSVGVLRRSPDLRYALRPEDVAALGPMQLALLARAARLVRPGGRIVYATCSVLRSENDAVVDDVLAGDQTLVERSRALLWPRNKDDGDGFFVAVLGRAPDER
ncbi:MAG: RsmB/NOP family class I SAM-dependent RNA methyltransferase [Deltaproteobacteria bacterium]|nr:RsmB/NOP family class I SAM-dependent RNA methyltransferase [Deltaproteobacteria bacterium]